MIENVTTVIVGWLNSFAEALSTWIQAHLWNILIILLVAWIIRSFTPRFITRLLHQTIPKNLYPTKADREKRIKTIDSLVIAVVQFLVFVIAGFLIIAQLSPGATATLFASAGILTVALGFGAQSLVKDFVSGIFVITENQYRVGDVIEIAGVNGTVEDVTIRTTVLRDADGNIHHVPNGLIEVTTNKSMGYSRINEQMVVPAGTDISLVEKVVNEVGVTLSERPEFDKKIEAPLKFGTIRGYAPGGGVIISVVGKISASDKLAIKSELYRELTNALNKEKIEVTSLPVLPTSGKKK